jgi:uncharacterized membrane protein
VPVDTPTPEALPVTTAKRLVADPARAAAWSAAIIFFVACVGASYARWANFEYRSFDLAFYVQGLWQLIHGDFDVSLLGVPLLGNHVEPIVFLMAPVFAVFPHPMTLVVIQNAALGAMGILAFNVARRLGLKPAPALLLALAILLTPATGYVALHEFHPEALAAPCLLLMVHSRLRNSLRSHWLCLVAVLACKENMALLVAAYCAVHIVLERARPRAELRAWYVWPLVTAVLWFWICTKFITPSLNAEAIDYLALYGRLGTSAGDIALKSITEPQRIVGAIAYSLRHGNLLWALLIPFLGLPLLRPHWLLISTPVLLQHLLSWRSSEWTIYFHYAAPLIPLFWVGLAQTVAGMERSGRVPTVVRRGTPFLIVIACVAAQILLGPAESVAKNVTQWRASESDRTRKTAFINQIPPTASLVAPLPYLSHLAMRERIFSLHFILKGLRTLSRTAYEPPDPTDFVLIDYDDSATFDPLAGYYHPPMKMADGRVVPSSDRLLHDFLRRASWTVTASNELTLYQQGAATASPPLSPLFGASMEIGPNTILDGIGLTNRVLSPAGIEIQMSWVFQDPREFFPAMFLRLTPRGRREPITISRGLCAPEKTGGRHQEIWRVNPSPRIPPGDYAVEAVFLDSAKALWADKPGLQSTQPSPNTVRVPLGEIKVLAADRSAN